MFSIMPDVLWHVKHNITSAGHFMQRHVKLPTVRKKKPASAITLQEHMRWIAAKGGKARGEKLSPKRKSAISRKAGKVGGAARAASMTPERRAEIARKAAAARWKKRGME